MGANESFDCYLYTKPYQSSWLPQPARQETKVAANEAQVEVWESLSNIPYSPIQAVENIEQYQAWEQAISNVQDPYQAAAARAALEHDLVETPQELAVFLGELRPLPCAVEEKVALAEEQLNPNEAYVLTELEKAHQQAGAEGFRAFAAELNQQAYLNPYPSRLFPGEIETEVSREKVLAHFYARNPEARSELGNWSPENLPEDIYKFFSFSQLEKAVAQDPGLLAFVQAQWKNLREQIGPLIYQDAKYDYYYQLSQELVAQGLAFSAPISVDNFSAPISVIDLDQMSQETYPAHFTYLAPDRVMVTVKFRGGLESAFYNVHDTSSIKNAFRWLFAGGEKDAYLLYYYPHIEERENGELVVDMNYSIKEGLPENLIGRNDFESNLSKTLSIFQSAFAQEDTYLDNARQELKEAFSDELLAKIKAAPQLDYEQVYQLMMVMQNSSCDQEVPKAFSLTTDEYQAYQQKIKALLDKKAGYTPASFLAAATEVCDGRIAMAAVISYNILFRKGATVYNSLFVRYPQTFKQVEDLQDQAGAIYHYMGCFFSAYALQRFLVHRYHNDEAFEAGIDAKADKLSSKASFDLPKKTISGLNEHSLLLLLQLRSLDEGGAGQREMMTMAGIFYEEVMEDRDISREIEFDFQGMAAGHAMYELITGQELTSNDATWSFDDNRREAFVDLLRYYADPKSLSASDQFLLLPWLTYF